MTLRELAEVYSKEYDFRVVDKNDKGCGRFERNELVMLDYKIADREVLKCSFSTEVPNLVSVKINWPEC